MKKKMKALVGLFLIAAMQVAMVFGASAVERDVVESDLSSVENMGPRYISSCPYGDKHEMVGRGLGFAFYGSDGSTDLRISGTGTQCKNCNLTLVTENNPMIVGVPWGKYAVSHPDHVVPTPVMMYTTSFGTISSTTDPYVQGFDFGRAGK